MNWLQGFIYGMISGITEFLPVSSQAHQRILLQIFGSDVIDPVCNLIVHLSALIALYISCRGLLLRLRREQKALQNGRRRGHGADARSTYDFRLVRTAVVPSLLFMLLLVFTRSWVNNNLLIAVFSIVNGIVLFITERFPHGNKDARYMSVLDAIVFGIAGALSVFPGISRVGTAVSYATVRGADRQHSLNWALLLSIPALLMHSIFDIVGIAAGASTVIGFSAIAGYVTAGFGAFIGTYLGVFIVRSVLSRSGSSAFAYYSWGISLLAFVLYLIS